MEQYQPDNKVSAFRLFTFLTGSIIIGLVIGALALVISNFIYYLFIFAVVIGFAASILINKFILKLKIHNKIAATVISAICGLSIAFAFYNIPYQFAKFSYINEVQRKYGVDYATANAGLNYSLKQDFGVGGFLGFMKYRAQEGDEYTSYIVLNSIPVHENSFTLRSTGAWLYWFAETLLFILPLAYIGYDTGRRKFCKSANDWYNTYLTQNYSVLIENKATFLTYFKTKDLTGIKELMLPEDGTQHPMLEIYEQRSLNKKGNVLISIKETWFTKERRIKRKLLEEWEVNEGIYEQVFQKEMTQN